MKWTLGRRLILIVLTACASACGADDPPKSLAGPSVFTGQVAGEWIGTSTLTNVSAFLGGFNECVGGDVAERVRLNIIPTDQVTLSMKQVSSTLTGRLTSTNTGLACSYQGSAALTTLALSAAKCDAPTLIVRCTNESVRNLELVGSSITGTFTAGHLSGVITNTYNVKDSQGSTGVAGLTLSYQYSAAR